MAGGREGGREGGRTRLCTPKDTLLCPMPENASIEAFLWSPAMAF